MAVTQSKGTGGKSQYFKIQHGSIERYLGSTFPEGVDPEFVREHKAGSRSKNPGTLSYYATNHNLSGELVRIEKVKNNYNSHDLVVTMNDGGQDLIISTDFYSAYSENLLNRLCSVAANLPNFFYLFACSIQATDEGGRPMFKDDKSPLMNSYSVLRQGGNEKTDTLKAFFKYKELPLPVKVMVKGDLVTDNSERMNTVFDAAVGAIKVNLGITNEPKEAQSSNEPAHTSTPNNAVQGQNTAFSTHGNAAPQQDDDDLPF